MPRTSARSSPICVCGSGARLRTKIRATLRQSQLRDRSWVRCSSLVKTHSRIDDGVENIGYQLTDQREDGKHQYQTHQHRIIAHPDRLEEQLTHPGPAEDLFQNDAAAKECSQFEA